MVCLKVTLMHFNDSSLLKFLQLLIINRFKAAVFSHPLALLHKYVTYPFKNRIVLLNASILGNLYRIRFPKIQKAFP